MRTVNYSGLLTARSSIAHGGRVTGTTANFRRETLMMPDGTALSGVPVVSGGVIRGELRRVASILFQTALTEGLDERRLPYHVVHAFRTGGSLTETRTKGEAITGAKQGTLRSLIPLIGIFGVAGGGRIMSGRLIVDKAIPLAQETAWLQDSVNADTLPSIWTLIQREQYSRVADVEDASAAPYVIREEGDVLPPGSGQMLWFQDALVAGARLMHSITLEDGTDAEAAFLGDVLAVWSRKAHIGGGKARGHGWVTPDYVKTETDCWGDPVPAAPYNWRADVLANRDEIMSALAWL